MSLTLPTKPWKFLKIFLHSEPGRNRLKGSFWDSDFCGNVMASLWTHKLTEGPSKLQACVSELPSSRATLVVSKLAIRGCKENVSVCLELFLNFIGLEYLLKGLPFLFFSARLALSFSPSGNHLASLQINWFWMANSLLHYREKLSQKLAAKHPDSQLTQNTQHQ